MTTRPAHPDDYAQATAVFTANGEMAPSALASSDVFNETAESGGIYLAVADERAVGVLVAVPIAYDGDRPYTLWVEAIIVHPDWRRRGIGTALYRALGVWARQVGVQGALTARQDDLAASALHRSVGFVTHRDDLLLWRFEE